MENECIKLYKKLTEWQWYKNSKMVHLFIHMLLMANTETKLWMGVMIEKGQLIVGRKTLSTETGISEQSIRTLLNKLKSTNELTIKSTNKFSIITLTNYNFYQNENKLTNQPIKQQTNQQLTSNQPTTNQQEFAVFKEVKTIYEDILTYLNNKMGTSYRATTKKNKTLINARIREGFELKDFIKVIDNKIEDWIGTDQQVYLRPETLFGVKFEGYLNQKKVVVCEMCKGVGAYTSSTGYECFCKCAAGIERKKTWAKPFRKNF